jgi:uncharacterized protein YoxC
MSPEVVSYVVTTLVVAIGGLLSLIGKFILDAIKDHLKAMKDNTIALAVLDKEIKNIMKNSDQIPELMKDLNNYFARLKQLEAEVKEMKP